MKEDAEFTEASEETLGGYELIVGEELQGILDNILQVDDEVNQWVIDYLSEEHGVERLGE